MSAEGSLPPLHCSVIIPTWQRSGVLRETLPAVLSQTYPSFDVHIVSDGNDPALSALAAEFSSDQRLHWHTHAENRGQAAARNTGARAAKGELLLFLDDDTPPVPDWIALHARRHQLVNAQSAGTHVPIVVTGTIEEQPTATSARATDAMLQRWWEQTLERYAQLLQQSGPDSVGDEFDTSVAFGLNCSIRRELFLRHGGYLEELRITDEDMELGLRLYLAGVETVFEPRAIVAHKSSKSMTAYLCRCWQASGVTDVHRVLQLGQRNAQTRRLISIVRGPLPIRMTRRLLWFGGGPLRSFVDLLEGLANSTSSRLLASAWGRICPSAVYWQSVRSTGCTLRQLRQQAAPAKCALMLHSICAPETTEESTYYLSPSRFRLLMNRFCASRYRTVTTSQWLLDDVPHKHALLTFDDGYDDLYTELLPWLQQHNFTALVFLVADHIGGANLWDQKRGLRARQLLTLTQIREMQRHGVEFGSHTLTHAYLPALSSAALDREVGDSRRKLEDLLGVEVTSFAYPYGGVDRRVRSAVARAGYKLAFTTLPGVNRWNDPLCQKRADIHSGTKLFELRFHLRYGRGFRQSGAALLRAMEQQAPTAILRGLAASVRRRGNQMMEKRSGRPTADGQTFAEGRETHDNHSVDNHE